MANGNPDLLQFSEDLSGGVDDEDDGLCMDIDEIWKLFDDSPDVSQNGIEDASSNPVSEGLQELELTPSLRPDLAGSLTFSSSSCHSEVFDYRTVASDGSLDSAGNSVMAGCAKLEPSRHTSSPMHRSSGSLADWAMPFPGYGSLSTERDGFSRDISTYNQHKSQETQFDMASTNASFRFANRGLNHQMLDKSGVTRGTNYNPNEYSLSISGVNDIGETSLMDLGEIQDFLCETSNQYPKQNLMNVRGQYITPQNQYVSGKLGHQSFSNNNEIIFNMKAETEDVQMQSASSHSAVTFEAQLQKPGEVSSEAFVNGKSVVGGLHVNGNHSSPYSRCSGYSLDNPGREHTSYKLSTHSLPFSPSNILSKKQMGCVKDEKPDTSVVSLGTRSQPFNLVDDVVSQNRFGTSGLSQTPSDNMVSISSMNHVVVKDEKNTFVSGNKGSKTSPLADAHCREVQASGKQIYQTVNLIKRQRQLLSVKKERETKLAVTKITCSPPLKNSYQAVEYNASSHRSYLDDDPDICILEDISEPARKNQLPVDGKSLVNAQLTSVGTSTNSMGLGGVRLNTDDERLIFRAALQDLSQPKSEVSLPDGILTVPLLRHQRIALSWLVQKETTSAHCCGGILADDQGLGKTVSTIALILKERPPSSSFSHIELKPKTETLNLDEDDDTVTVLDGIAESCQANGNSVKLKNASAPAKGRLAAGTLVVCPTSVLRQWNDELHNKVNSNENISVLVYHGGNRTKDPLELTKYDVVLTTYSIVSMEVPKQPLVDEDEDETKRSSQFTTVGPSSSKKRKYPPSSDKKSLKGKKGINSELFESLARPLAKVLWFRVVLDEAQSIKNHRTQVARACWGLRAKRRWCLSGTPIQNAIDDLYSYFRFLKYEPYATYKSFCSQIKLPIQKNPTNGYKKLQAILKTVMLRRTKGRTSGKTGTLLDGEPIINLPPKTIELKKVDFTSEERDFYSRLEADSRAQFEEYAAAGTVKQNYVNILLMLLRLRQACDHPLLVQGGSSNNEWRSSLEMAKKLPREKQIRLLSCLEASLAICGLCTDPPEDAVVTSCEHVFCNQCILEHLSGDNNQCPSANCKIRVSISSLFSRATLRSSLGDQPGQEGSLESSGTISAIEPCALVGPSDSLKITAAEADPCSSSDDSCDSSKIKAALEVLQSLTKPCGSTAITNCPSFIGGNASSPTHSSRGSASDISGNRNSKVGEKAIVFSQWTRMLDLLEARLKTSSINYRRLDGTMSVHARDKAVKDFNSIPEVTVMIMSLKAASLGLNMVAACHVLLLDLWWNPTTEDQAIDRAHRIGQTRPVTVLRLTVKDTVEDRILALQQKKREMVASAFGEDEMGGNQTRLTVDDLKYLFMA